MSDRMTPDTSDVTDGKPENSAGQQVNTQQQQAPAGNGEGQPVPNAAPTPTDSVTDVVSREDTLNVIKRGGVAYVAAGLGIGISGWTIMNAVTGGEENLGTAIVGAVLALASMMALSLIGASSGLFTAFYVRDELDEDVPENLRYATAGLTAFIGHLAILVLGFTITMAGFSSSGSESGGSPGVGDYLFPIVVGAVGAAIVAAGAVYALENVAQPQTQPAPQAARSD